MRALRDNLYAPFFGAAVALLLAAPCGADEVAYLMYIKGSEGPPATPIRVLWNVLDESNARITIDLRNTSRC